VVGVDTHPDEHVLAVVAAPAGAVVATQAVETLHTVVLHRRQHDPQTRDYIAR
jgi:hypothetical protein